MREKDPSVQEFKEAFNLFPWYVYIGLMIGSLLLGSWIRKYLDRKQALREKQDKIDRKEAKKEAKRQARIRKKKLKG